MLKDNNRYPKIHDSRLASLCFIFLLIYSCHSLYVSFTLNYISDCCGIRLNRWTVVFITSFPRWSVYLPKKKNRRRKQCS